MATQSEDNEIIFSDEDKTIYKNTSFNKKLLNQIVKDKSNN